jgi:two-component system OmpR family response regulator
MRILIVEDNVELARQIKAALEEAKYVAEVAHEGEQAYFLGDTEAWDLVLLDLGLPDMHGIEVLERWRASGNQVPVLVLTSRQTWREKVAGLRAGADDYLVKPFEYEELMARIEALIRRFTGFANTVLVCSTGRVVLDPTNARVTLDGEIVNLTTLEYRTLHYLMRHKGEVISKTELTEHIYEQDFDLDSNVIEVLVNRLRNKLCTDLIETRRGLGYQVRATEQPA